MCDFSNGFVLCTCEQTPKTIIHHKNSRKHKRNPPLIEDAYRWYLYRVELREDNIFLMEGLCAMPSDQIGNGLAEDWVLLNLNYEKCFDFEYTPQEGDNLIMSNAKNGNFLSFIFRNEEWTIGTYDVFLYIHTLKNNGKIQDIPK